MAEATIAAIVALHRRGNEHIRKGRYAAAAEKFREAALILAPRLPGIAEDNLIALYMQVQLCGALMSQSRQTRRLLGDENLEWRAFGTAINAVLIPTLDSLTRRMDAGSLLPGCCFAAEEACYVALRTGEVNAVSQQALTNDPTQYGRRLGFSVCGCCCSAECYSVGLDWHVGAA